MCRVCGWKVETWAYVWVRCVGGGSRAVWQEMVGEVLGDDGEGNGWLRLVEEWRNECERMERNRGTVRTGGRSIG
ncbi:hypothetical protein PV327_011194, partial [Microctonus hyperodae]